MDTREKELVVAALENACGNQSQAARDLGISRGADRQYQDVMVCRGRGRRSIS
ncbi:MAG: hypothetical protein GY811_13150 [Myxococcales bacterium]|nr:hypothetical protein [Myxococcales bacterium]